MTQLLLQPLSEISNLINGFRHVCNITPAAPPRPGGSAGAAGRLLPARAGKREGGKTDARTQGPDAIGHLAGLR